MALHPLAGQPAPPSTLIDVAQLRAQYASEKPDPTQAAERVSFGTSGHRGSAARRSFNEAHIMAIVQATCEYRRAQGIDGPLFLGADSHALSSPAQVTALEVLAGNDVDVLYGGDDVVTPTPAVSRAIVDHNRGRRSGLADGLIITPSHNPPDDGGIKYNPPHGGPSGAEASGWIERRANELLGALGATPRIPLERARATGRVRPFDFVTPYVEGLAAVLDLEPARGARLAIGADPLGGASVAYWAPIAEKFGLNIDVVNPRIDPTFAFMPLDHDGKIRMDCSSPYAMANLVRLKDKYDVAFGNDADADRHGIVTKAGLMNPNHYLAAAVDYLFRHRPGWAASAGVGKTLVTSAMLDRVAARLGRRVFETPVGFKYFVNGLADGSLAFAGEESAGASLSRLDGSTWTTDKDGLALDLLAVEMLAKTGEDPAQRYRALAEACGDPAYVRLDRPATPAQKAALKRLSPEAVRADTLAGEAVLAKLTRAPGDDEPIGGLKVVTENGWFAARPSGTEDVYKIYAESFRGQAHLDELVAEASRIVDEALRA
ncbi:MAG: phosphoglucomutase (alpha-D-glucose-1,6-bisphosphate-dependent) [Polyangiaceae bacterium]|jgi:phosphoglucomutase|nr:phosphoglucomutase (alpha-D-glucose-1,6-bisphosphate-dependent) [Polyangiaceae bacterium]